MNNKRIKRTKGKITIYFDPKKSEIPFVNIASDKHVEHYYVTTRYKNLLTFKQHNIPWQHVQWLLAWKPIIDLIYDKTALVKSSRNPADLVHLVPRKPPAEPLGQTGNKKITQYKQMMK